MKRIKVKFSIREGENTFNREGLIDGYGESGGKHFAYVIVGTSIFTAPLEALEVVVPEEIDTVD